MLEIQDFCIQNNNVNITKINKKTN